MNLLADKMLLYNSDFYPFNEFLFLFKIHSIKRMLNRSSLVRDKTVTAFVDYWRKSFKITRPVTVFSSDEYLSPFTVGLFRPRIFIPEQLLEDMDRKTINSIIAHVPMRWFISNVSIICG